MSPPEDVLDRAAEQLDLELPGEQRRQLVALARAVDAWGRTSNLTGHRTAEAVMQRLVLDALALGRELPDHRSLADLGSGAGFPGLPLAIVNPAREFVLVESRMRRHHFQRAMVRELGLTNVATVHGRLESVLATRCDLAVAQALARPERAAEWLGLWITQGGSIAIPGTADNPPVPGPGFRGQLRRYRVPVANLDRTVWIGTVAD